MRLILTGDVVSTLNGRYGIPLYLDQDRRLDELERKFLEDLASSIFSDYDCLVLSNREVIDLYEEHTSRESLPVVSIDDLWKKEGIFYFEINRKLDSDSGDVYLAPRAGHESLENQVKHLVNQLPQGEVMLVDRGCIAGGTILYSASLLGKEGIRVRKVLLGPHRKEGFDRLKSELGSSVEISLLSHDWNCEEWVESRDLVGISGRILKNGGHSPYFAQPSYISARINDPPSFRQQCEYFLREVEMRGGVKLNRSQF